MPVVLGVDHKKRLTSAVAMGSVTYADAQLHMQHEIRENAVGYKKFVDFRGAGVQVTPAEIRELVSGLQNLAGTQKVGPTAVVVSSDVAFGMIRMLEAQIEGTCEIRPFRDEAEARAWLESK